MNRIRSQVLDVTFASQFFLDRISDWHISSQETLSDHKKINFKIQMERRDGILYRNPRNTNWENFSSHLRENLLDLPQPVITTTTDLDRAVVNLTNALSNAYVSSCPGRRGKPRKNHWWNRELQALKRECRRLFRQYRRSPEESKALGNLQKETQ